MPTKAERAVELAKLCPDLSFREQGELDVLLERHVNTASPKLVDVLYGQPPAGWGFPPRFIKEGNRNTTRLARDVDALLSLLRHHPGDRRLELCLLLSDRLTQLKTLGCDIDPDGRIRYSGNITGTETQRHAVHKSNTGTGYNLQVTTSGHKHLFLADEGHWIFSVDLSGSDGWTIGCECAGLGDPTMLNDLRAGLKPAQAVCLLYQNGKDVNTWDYPQLLAAAKQIDKESWLYMAFKKGIWGTCYGMGEQKLIDVIARESYGDTGKPLFVDVNVIRSMRTCTFARYPGIQRRQARLNMLLERDGFLEFANGSRREFLGNHRDDSVQREAYGAHPQVVTTWVTSLAWHKLWYDPENIRVDGSRIAQPLLLVHDSIMGQFPKERLGWATNKLKEWLDNPVMIAGTQLTIPWAGGYGRSWGELEEGELKP